MKNYVTYLRVSTRKQGKSGLGLDAQRKMCEDFVNANNGNIIQEFVDVESGTHRNRKGLQDAIAYCKTNATPLVIAKLDRLARDVEFCFKVVNTGIEIHFTDMPQMNTLLLGVFAAVAQYERELTSDRTKKALAVKKANGSKLGASNDKYKEIRNNKTAKELAEESERRGYTKRTRYQESRDVQAMLKALHSVFPDATNGNPTEWDWNSINTKGESKNAILKLMADYNYIDPTIFVGWDFSAANVVAKLRSFLQSIEKSFFKS